MIRLARPLGFVFISPSRDQVKTQRAPEAVPLILEPISHFNTDPVVVLDFQSLYPSIIIAYNYCFSTCLGKVSLLFWGLLLLLTISSDTDITTRHCAAIWHNKHIASCWSGFGASRLGRTARQPQWRSLRQAGGARGNFLTNAPRDP